MIRSLVLVGLATVFLGASASAQNLVSNPNFSSGLTGWTTHTCGSCSAAGWNTTSSAPNDPGTKPVSLTSAALTACVSALCNDPVLGDTLSQTLTTIPGQSYTLSFYYDPGVGGSTTELDVYWNGALVTGGQIINSPASTWITKIYTVT